LTLSGSRGKIAPPDMARKGILSVLQHEESFWSHICCTAPLKITQKGMRSNDP